MIVTSACPSCGAKNTRETYDIGDGPELSCVMCEWCWGADGQVLTMGPIEVLASLTWDSAASSTKPVGAQQVQMLPPPDLTPEET